MTDPDITEAIANLPPEDKAWFITHGPLGRKWSIAAQGYGVKHTTLQEFDTAEEAARGAELLSAYIRATARLTS